MQWVECANERNNNSLISLCYSNVYAATSALTTLKETGSETPWNAQICAWARAARLWRWTDQPRGEVTLCVRTIRSSLQTSIWASGVRRELLSSASSLSSSFGPPHARTLVVAREEAREALVARIVDAMGGTELDMALIHGDGVFDWSCDRRRQVWRDGDRGGGWEE